MIPIAIPPDQVRAVRGGPWPTRPQPRRCFREAFRLGPQGLFQDSAMLRFGGVPQPRSPPLERLNETVLETPHNQLAHTLALHAIIE